MTMPNCCKKCFSYDIEITSEITGKAPVPELLVGVKQEGKGRPPFQNVLIEHFELLASYCKSLTG